MSLHQEPILREKGNYYMLSFECLKEFTFGIFLARFMQIKIVLYISFVVFKFFGTFDSSKENVALQDVVLKYRGQLFF